MLSVLPLLKLLLGLTIMLIFFSSGTNGRVQAKKCANHGKMVIEDKKSICRCLPPFTGRFCEDFVCVNGVSTGRHNPSPLLNKRCQCDSGWTGTLCDINLCGKNGEERNGECVCNENFIGDRYQYVTFCKNGQLSDARCSCYYGWSGDLCDKIICHQGEPDETNEKCNCPSKYRGRFCDFCADPASSPPPECAVISGRRSIQIDKDDVPIIRNNSSSSLSPWTSWTSWTSWTWTWTWINNVAD